MTVRPPPPVVLLLSTNPATPSPLPLTFLIESGYEISDHRHASDGLVVARTIKPDVVLVDVPEKDAPALELCRSLQADPDTTAIPIIAIAPPA